MSVKGDRGARALDELASETIVDGASADDGAGRQGREIVLHRSCDDAIGAIENQGIVAHVAVQGVGNDGVAAELEILATARLLVAEVGNHAAVLIDRKDGIERVFLGDLRVHALERAEQALARFVRNLGVRRARLL
jgi:hypothetical protein